MHAIGNYVGMGAINPNVVAGGVVAGGALVPTAQFWMPAATPFLAPWLIWRLAGKKNACRRKHLFNRVKRVACEAAAEAEVRAQAAVPGPSYSAAPAPGGVSAPMATPAGPIATIDERAIVPQAGKGGTAAGLFSMKLFGVPVWLIGVGGIAAWFMLRRRQVAVA